MIDPAIWADEDVGCLSHGAFRLFIGCISNADDDGKLEASARRLRGIVFSFSDDVTVSDVEGWLGELGDTIRSFHRYTVEGKEYVKLLKWHQWQTIKKPQPSPIPDPKNINELLGSESVENQGGTDGEPVAPKRREGKGREFKRKEGEGKGNSDNRKVSDNPPSPTPHAKKTFPEVHDAYKEARNLSGNIPINTSSELDSIAAAFGEQYVIAAIRHLCDGGRVRQVRPSYIKGMLKSMSDEGQLEDLLDYLPETKTKTATKPASNDRFAGIPLDVRWSIRTDEIIKAEPGISRQDAMQKAHVEVYGYPRTR
jgi:hypothetical protein